MDLHPTFMKGKELGNTKVTSGDCSLSQGLGWSAGAAVLPRTSEKEGVFKTLLEIFKKNKTGQT